MRKRVLMLCACLAPVPTFGLIFFVFGLRFLLIDSERMVNSAQERKAAMRKKGLERQQAQIGAAQDLQEENEEQEGLSAGSCSAAPADSDDGTASTSVGSCSAPPSDDEEDVIAGGIGSCSAPPPSDGDGDVTTGDVGSCSAPPPPPDGDRDSTAADVGSCSAPPSEVDDTTATVGSCSAPPPGEADDHGAGSCSAPPSDDNSAADASSDAVGSRADPPAVDGAASIDAKKGTAAVTPRALDPMAAKAGVSCWRYDLGWCFRIETFAVGRIMFHRDEFSCKTITAVPARRSAFACSKYWNTSVRFYCIDATDGKNVP